MSGVLLVPCCLIIFAIYVWLTIRARITRVEWRSFRFHIDPFVALMKLKWVGAKVFPLLHRQRLALSLLNGGKCTSEMFTNWAAESFGLGYLALMGTGVLALLARNPTLLFFGILLGACLPMLRAKELSNKVIARRHAILMELPELLSKLLLMVNAGENVMKALARAAEQKANSDNPLYRELKAALEGLKRGENLAVALEEMGRRCAVPEVQRFATTILINARRGGGEFVPALRELTRQMWEKRKTIARTLGEQASTRMAFPLTIIFMIIMVLVGAPTVLMM
ncbi:type II secretion protein F [Cohnella endophytica]|uniref:Type II secretion protein F n=1 Tax=Cohnella endophytica TaxID=2419778 RepID=A0A494XT22_9BACL|nr:type II secretion system F family protein [Cohnella endophytica]RKP53813.1 type II secretion protein F [Cohnella endophytica]